MNYTFECNFYYYNLDKFSRALDFAKTVCLSKYGMLFRYDDTKKSITFYDLRRSDVMVLLSADALVKVANDIMVSVGNKGEQLDGSYIKTSFGDIVFLDRDFEKSIDKLITKCELNKKFEYLDKIEFVTTGRCCDFGCGIAWPNRQISPFEILVQCHDFVSDDKENKAGPDPKKIGEPECLLSDDPISIHFVFKKEKKFKANQMFADARMDVYLKDYIDSCGIEYDVGNDTFIFLINTKRKYATVVWRQIFDSYFEFLEDVEYEYYTSLGERSLDDLKLPEGHIIWK